MIVNFLSTWLGPQAPSGYAYALSLYGR